MLERIMLAGRLVVTILVSFYPNRDGAFTGRGADRVGRAARDEDRD